MSVDYERRDRIAIITIERSEVRNAIDRATASALGDAWRTFDSDSRVDVGVLHGAGGHFSSGADLKAFDLVDGPDGYLGFTRMQVGKPTIAAIDGYCVAGGLEMALWCDLRVAGSDAILGCLERRFGAPLVDGGTVRLTHVVGLGVAMELILTGREVNADEAHVIGLVNSVVPAGTALDRAVALAAAIAAHPQATVRSDRAAVLGALGLATEDALELERRLGGGVLDVAALGADRFAAGVGRAGSAVPPTDTTVTVEPARLEWQSVSPSESAVGEVSERETPEAGADSGPADPRFGTPPAGHGRPLIVAATAEEELWRNSIEATLHRMGYVTYAVSTEGDLETDIAALEDAIAAVFASAVVIGDRVGIVALGGAAGAVFHCSTIDSRVSAVVEFSGRQPGAAPSFRLAAASYLGHHGSADDGADVISPFRMEAALRDMGLDATFHSYRGVGRDFFVPGVEGHHPTFTDVAWQRTRLFLQRAV